MSEGQNEQELNFSVHVVTEGTDEKGWIHTHGLCDYGCPEIEMRGVPLFLMEPAAGLMEHIALYVLEQKTLGGRTVKLGDTMRVSQRAVVRFVKAPPIASSENHYEVERWTLSDDPMVNQCFDCGTEMHGDEPADHPCADVRHNHDPEPSNLN